VAAASRRIAVIGGGWAGLAAAVKLVESGHQVSLFDMAPQLGGRAREVSSEAPSQLDNGQHILIGAYAATLGVMRTLGLPIENLLLRTPLRLCGPDGRGLLLSPGTPSLAFAGAVMRHGGWRWADKLRLLRTALGWAASNFSCDEHMNVARLTAHLPATVRHDLIDPLCVAALNTPAEEASAAVFLRVMKDALFAGPGSSDLLLPRTSLSQCLPLPAAKWLQGRGAEINLGTRVQSLQPAQPGWLVDGVRFDAVVLAASPRESARLVQHLAPAWADAALALKYEPIVTVYAQAGKSRLPEPMLALPTEHGEPAQFVFDRGQLGGPAGLLAFVISGAQPWLDRGTAATEAAVLAQARQALGALLSSPPHLVRTLTEKRATFRCTPGLQRPAGSIAPGLWAAGDHVHGPYPATLEGAVRSGLEAAQHLRIHIESHH
jgi:hydroxysqualene dehydroxylase